MISQVEKSIEERSKAAELPRKLIEELLQLGYPEPVEVYLFEESVDIVWYDPHVDITICDDLLTATRRSPYVLCLDDIVVTEYELPTSDPHVFIAKKCRELILLAAQSQQPENYLKKMSELEHKCHTNGDFPILLLLHKFVQKILSRGFKFDVSDGMGQVKWMDAKLSCVIQEGTIEIKSDQLFASHPA
tara:strand:+ start:763 stop:1329 length:567 start_codon:yes stop_codon:yes gene_type:complete